MPKVPKPKRTKPIFSKRSFQRELGSKYGDKDYIHNIIGNAEKGRVSSNFVRALQSIRLNRFVEEINPERSRLDSVQTYWKYQVDMNKKATLLKQQYQRELEFLKTNLPKRLNVSKETIQKARDKLKKITDSKVKIIRFENLGVALSKINDPKAFADSEASITSDYPFSAGSRKQLEADPKTLFNHYWHTFVDEFTHSAGSGKYTSVVFFEPSSFSHDGQWANQNWGTIKDVSHNSILGIQVLHWDPKVAYLVTKAMLKRRSKDPIVIFDIYGDVFFP